MVQFNELNGHNSTIVVWNDKELRTTQDPHITDDGTEYKAHAIDEKGNEYIIVWEVTDHETTDESSTCDWDNPTSVTII